MALTDWALTGFTPSGAPPAHVLVPHTDPVFASSLSTHGTNALTGAFSTGNVETCGRCLHSTTSSRSYTTNTYAEAYFNIPAGTTTPLDLVQGYVSGGYVFLSSATSDQMGSRTQALEISGMPGYYLKWSTKYLTVTPQLDFFTVTTAGFTATTLYVDIGRVRNWLRIKLQREYVSPTEIRLIAKTAPGEDEENWTTRMDQTVTSAATDMWIAGVQGAMGFKIRRPSATSTRFSCIDGWSGGMY